MVRVEEEPLERRGMRAPAHGDAYPAFLCEVCGAETPLSSAGDGPLRCRDCGHTFEVVGAPMSVPSTGDIRVVVALVEALEVGDIDGALQLLTPDATWWDPEIDANALGRDAIAAMWRTQDVVRSVWQAYIAEGEVQALVLERAVDGGSDRLVKWAVCVEEHLVVSCGVTLLSRGSHLGGRRYG